VTALDLVLCVLSLGAVVLLLLLRLKGLEETRVACKAEALIGDHLLIAHVAKPVGAEDERGVVIRTPPVGRWLGVDRGGSKLAVNRRAVLFFRVLLIGILVLLEERRDNHVVEIMDQLLANEERAP